MLEELLRPMVENPNAATNSAMVAALMRLGVSQVSCRVCSQVRAPVAAAAAVMAHAAHMSPIVERWAGGGARERLFAGAGVALAGR